MTIAYGIWAQWYAHDDTEQVVRDAQRHNGTIEQIDDEIIAYHFADGSWVRIEGSPMGDMVYHSEVVL